jgi:hypothetical protein
LRRPASQTTKHPGPYHGGSVTMLLWDIQGRGASVAMRYDLVIAVLHIIYRYSRAIRSDAGAMTIYHLERASDNSFRRFELPPAGVGAVTTEPRTCLISSCIIRLQVGRRQCQVVRATGCAARDNRAIDVRAEPVGCSADAWLGLCGLGNSGSAKPKTACLVVGCEPTLPWLLS